MLSISRLAPTIVLEKWKDLQYVYSERSTLNFTSSIITLAKTRTSFSLILRVHFGRKSGVMFVRHLFVLFHNVEKQFVQAWIALCIKSELEG